MHYLVGLKSSWQALLIKTYNVQLIGMCMNKQKVDTSQMLIVTCYYKLIYIANFYKT